MTSQPGRLGQDTNGDIYVEFVRELEISIETAWTWITDQAHIERYFPGFKLDARPGGTFEIWFGGVCEGPAHVSGTISQIDPPSSIGIGASSWQLEVLGEHQCRTIFRDTLNFTPDRSRQDIALAVLGGWHNYMDFFTAAIAGEPIDFSRPEPDYSQLDVQGWHYL